MAFTEALEIREVHGIPAEQLCLIRAFIQGLVYGRLSTCPEDEFTGSDLMGGHNRDWTGTPMIELCRKHIALGKAHTGAVSAAGRDFGWLLKSVLANDVRTFRMEKTEDNCSSYRWVR